MPIKLSVLLIISLILPAIVHSETGFFQGTMDPGSGFSVQVDPLKGGNDTFVLYDSSGQDGLTLTASALPHDGFEWQEHLYARDQNNTLETGRFKGSLAPDGKSATGVWISTDGSKQRSFRLTRAARLIELDADAGRIQVRYPQFDDPRMAPLNVSLANEAKRHLRKDITWARNMRRSLKSDGGPAVSVAAISRTDACRVVNARSDLVSLLCWEYEFAGGAHGNTEYYTRNYAIPPNGKFRRLGLWEVLDRSPQAITRLSELMLRDLARQQASSVTSGSIHDFNQWLESSALPWYILPAGLAIEFSPYAVGSYAEGTFRVVIPYSSLTPFLHRDGPLWPYRPAPSIGQDTKP